MRRLASAPANLCMLAHRKKRTEEVAAAVPPPPSTSRTVVARAIKRGDAIDEVVISCSKDFGLHDTTEMMVLDTLARWVVSVPANLERAFTELLVRALVSVITHRLMDALLSTVHERLHL